ncbi:MAG: beta-galactosidase, partial [Clostridia bacterium]|nr:beta-galactosidase [Clostridia bacterium]
VLDQGYYPDGIITAPTEEALIRDIQCGMEAGFNGARLHQKVFEPRYLYHCDRLGYMVWGEYGSWGMDFSDVSNLSTFLPDWTSAVRRDYNHPAIIGWCPLNETYDYGPQQKRQDDSLIRIVYEQTKMADPTRPCIDTSGFFHVVTDIYDIHDYGQDTVSWKANFDKLYLENHLHDFLGRGRQKWKGEPVFISEYGGIGFCLPKRDGVTHTAWSYGESMKTYEEFYKKYKGLTDALLDNPMIMGYCYTQLTDVEQEQNGLFTYEERNPKFDMSIISAINRRKAAIED